LLIAMVVGWGVVSTGLVSSNDGSHVALARALALRGETTIDPDGQLTLWVDRARRDGHDYSDRPPGTAFLAMPAVAIGNALDPWLLRESLARREVFVVPATARYAHTYAIRARGRPPLAALQGTALALAGHTALIGAVGLVFVVLLLARLGVERSGQVFAVAALGLGSLWGPYSTMLFSHGTSATLVAATILLLHVDGERPRRWAAVLAGLAGGWAVASDYLLVLAVVPFVLACVPWRRWPLVLAGAAPIAVVTLAYHAVAFGSIWSIGYDFQTNFDFARSRAATFDGNFLRGLWVLWGAGEGAGVLVQAPVLFAGVVGLAAARRGRRWLLAFLPWAAVLCLHHTPWGGATRDHRYLIPALPLLGAGLGLAWQRWVVRSSARSRLLAVGLIVLVAASSLLVWSHFFSWRG